MRAITAGPFVGLAHRGGRGREQLVDLLGLGDRARLATAVLERDDALLGDRAVGVEVAHEPQHGALARRRERPPAGSHVGDEQVDGVRADVEDSEAHG